MHLRCSACRKKKPSTSFNKNRANKSGFDCYCKACRSAYYVNGKTWDGRGERAQKRIVTGRKRCADCGIEKPLSDFPKHKQQGDGFNPYCKICNSIRAKGYYENNKDKVKKYNQRSDVIARIDAWKRATPRHSLSMKLIAALQHRPTKNPVTVDDLMTMWRAQDGLCLLSDIRMTWKTGKTARTSISIDRKNSSLGYTKENVRLICWAINAFKGNGTDDEMMVIAEALVAKRRTKTRLRLVA